MSIFGLTSRVIPATSNDGKVPIAVRRLAAPVQPHMLQRAYIARSDFDLRIVIGAMLLAPFIAQPPGIVIGLTKAANDPAWPAIDQEATAFSGLTAQLKLVGPVPRILSDFLWGPESP